jgi:hypothetical protein
MPQTVPIRCCTDRPSNKGSRPLPPCCPNRATAICRTPSYEGVSSVILHPRKGFVTGAGVSMCRTGDATPWPMMLSKMTAQRELTLADRRRQGRMDYQNTHLIALLRGRSLDIDPAEAEANPKALSVDDLAPARGITLGVSIGTAMWQASPSLSGISCEVGGPANVQNDAGPASTAIPPGRQRLPWDLIDFHHPTAHSGSDRRQLPAATAASPAPVALLVRVERWAPPRPHLVPPGARQHKHPELKS